MKFKAYNLKSRLPNLACIYKIRVVRLSIIALAFSIAFLQSLGAANAPPQQDNRQTKSGLEGWTAPRTDAGSGGDSRSLNRINLATDEDYRISPNDVIQISIDKGEELSGNYSISASGAFEMPFLHQIQAGGKTTQELARFIADGLRGRYLVDPQVKVVVSQYSGRSFFIQGAVRSPGLYQIGGYPTLLELITIAGGLADNHGSTAFIIRKSKQGDAQKEGASSFENDVQPGSEAAPPETDSPQVPQYELVKANINGLLKGLFNHNVVIEPGDIVNIPPSDVFFLAGEVNAPGSFPLKVGTTLRQAISLGQGTTFKAATSRAIIFREDPATSKRIEIKVDIGDVMSGKKEDIPIVANDVIIVPDSRLKSVGSVFLRAFGVSSTRIIRPF